MRDSIVLYTRKSIYVKNVIYLEFLASVKKEKRRDRWLERHKFCVCCLKKFGLLWKARTFSYVGSSNRAGFKALRHIQHGPLVVRWTVSLDFLYGILGYSFINLG